MTVVTPLWLDHIKRFEGCKLNAYQDSAGVWTIGYGHTRGVHPGDVCTQTQADAWLIADLESAAGAVESLTHTVDLTDGQRDALIDFVYNLGAGAFAKSTLLKCVLAGDHAGAAAQLSRWVYADGKKLPGLVDRRAREVERYLSPMPAPQAPAPRQEAATPPVAAEPVSSSPPVVLSPPPATSAGASVAAGAPALSIPEPPAPKPLTKSRTMWLGGSLAGFSSLQACADWAQDHFEDWWNHASDFYDQHTDLVNWAWGKASALQSVRGWWLWAAVALGGIAFMAFRWHDRKRGLR